MNEFVIKAYQRNSNKINKNAEYRRLMSFHRENKAIDNTCILNRYFIVIYAFNIVSNSTDNKEIHLFIGNSHGSKNFKPSSPANRFVEYDENKKRISSNDVKRISNSTVKNQNAIIKPQKHEMLNHYLGYVVKVDQHVDERKLMQINQKNDKKLYCKHSNNLSFATPQLK